MKYKTYQIKHVIGVDRYIHALEIIGRELKDIGFRHRYLEKEKRLVLGIDDKADVSELGRKLKESDLILKVLR